MSCLAEQAKILVEEALENSLGVEAFNSRWARWHTCSLCKQNFHGVVFCALGWACWKTYLGRPETDVIRGMAMNMLGTGLNAAKHHEDALSVNEAELALRQRLGADERDLLNVRGNLASTYAMLGRWDESLGVRRDIYSGFVRVLGEEDRESLSEAHNFALSLVNDRVRKFGEAKSLLRKSIPVAQRVLGEGNENTLRMRMLLARALCQDPAATLDDIREAVTTLEDTASTARRVLGGAHPFISTIDQNLAIVRGALRNHETPGGA